MLIGYEYIKDERFARRLTLRQLADAIGYSNAYISQLENGKVASPSHKVIQKITAFFEVTPKVKTADFTRVDRLEAALEAMDKRLRALEGGHAVMGAGGGRIQGATDTGEEI